MKNIMMLLALFVLGHTATAQFAMFGKSGVVTYDKTMYIKNIMRKQYLDKSDDRSRSQFESMIPNAPENLVLKKTLKFNGNETLFEPVKQDLDAEIKQFIMMLAIDFDATTLSDLKTKDYKRYNDIIGQKIVIQDTVKTIEWKVTDEYREIAGYNCRRANGITPDSTYVIGYYSNELLTNGGPESINGLPGLILGLVVPSQHVSYFATKVELMDNVVLDKKLFNNTKTKRMNRTDIAKMMNDTFSSFLNKETIDYVIKLALM
ncbi:GLPGLI family protein [Sphingobacterium yanglingense]|uniref:GLPGLI family protein n=1 Tax=Sphingobacterium yanglingense TaxID=1437280 RepID=A0A4R6WL33_9SPHI|nr:GLPGLI family protein [Sphingobacterium yanglingense]TDQ76561.1 GLPGLI family protein [Sphingobacterium yanglingense]